MRNPGHKLLECISLPDGEERTNILTSTLTFISSTFLLDKYKRVFLEEKKLIFYLLLAYPQQPRQISLLLEGLFEHFQSDEAMLEIFYEGVFQIFNITDEIRHLAPVCIQFKVNFGYFGYPIISLSHLFPLFGIIF